MLYHYILVINKPVNSYLFSRISHDEHQSQSCGTSSLTPIMTGMSGQAIVARAPPSIVPISVELQVAISDVEAISDDWCGDSVGGMEPMSEAGEESRRRVAGSCGGGGGGW